MAVNIPTNTNYEVASAVVTAYPFTMACWFYVSSTTANRTLMDLGSTTADSGQLLIANNAAAVGITSRIAGAQSSAVTSTTYSANTWHHAAAVVNSATDRRAFLDGGSKGTNATSRAFAGTIDRTEIGRSLRTNVYATSLNGRIAECAIWSATLNDDEVYALGRGYRASLLRPDALVFYAPFIRPVLDLAGGQTLTVVGGTPTVIEHPRRIA
jgi:hypothetical protein